LGNYRAMIFAFSASYAHPLGADVRPRCMVLRLADLRLRNSEVTAASTKGEGTVHGCSLDVPDVTTLADSPA
jgi:hypothetical protein